MPWRGARRDFCKLCKRPRMEGELFSARGKCADCGNGNMVVQVNEMRNHRGAYFEEWRRTHAAAVGAVLLDDLPPEVLRLIRGSQPNKLTE